MKQEYNTELDCILKELIVAYENHFKGFADALKEPQETTKGKTTQKIKDSFSINDWEINLLYENLLQDGYIKSIDPLEISFKGLVFINSGGYTQNIININSEKIRLQNLEENTLKNNNRIVFLTFLLVLGTLIAGWYYATELWKYYHSCHS